MANQSSVQSLLQQLAGTASAGQANLPSAVNNGNPNTIYNQPLKAGGYLPPVTNGLDQWRINPAQTAPSTPINWQQLAANSPGNNLSSILPKYPTVPPVVPITPGTPLPPVIPPVQTGGGGGTQTGGPLPPTPSTGGGFGGGDGSHLGGNGGFLGGRGPNDRVFQPGSSNGWELIGGMGGLSSNFTTSPHGGSISTGDILNSFSGLGHDLSIPLGSFGQGLANSGLGHALGVAPDGSFNLLQALDWVLPGNLYMSQTGQTNLANIIPAIFTAINPLLGMGVSAVMDSLGQKYANVDDTNLNWLQKALKTRYVKNQANKHPQSHTGNAGGPDPYNFGGFGNPFFGQFGDGLYHGTPHVEIGGSGPGQISDVAGGNNNNNGGAAGTPGTPAPIVNPGAGGTPQVGGGGGGPSRTTDGFSYAFRGGSDMADVRNFLNNLRIKSGNVTR